MYQSRWDNNVDPKTKHRITTPKKQLKTRTKFTILSMINIVWYTIVVIVSSWFEKTIPSELTIAWFSAWTIELALLFGIKVRSKDYKDSGGSDYDELEKADEEIEKNNALIDAMNKFDIQDINHIPDYDDDVG